MIQYFRDGGFFVWLILGCSIWAFTLIVERFLFYRRLSRSLKKVSHIILEQQKKPLVERIAQIEKLSYFWGKKKITRTLIEISHNQENMDNFAVEDLVKEVVLLYLNQIDKGLMSISTLAGIQPLLGLLGTITGMMITFEAISTAGTGDPKILAKGISEAMITTQAGMFSAVPLILCHRFLKNKSKDICEKLRILFTSLLKEIK